ncbi:M1 family metallopeptidase [Gaetbulibacter sp. M240]|uniref:M1 family metallopeptidase n=1 Tax=Gaetbulibacter sp. M240 TaxID=3126511 RepID=UPI00374EE356
MKKQFLIALLIILSALPMRAQLLSSEEMRFTHQDTLRGSITPERAWWDLTYYHLDIEVKPDEKFISGKNTVQYKVLQSESVMQIDLQAPLKITKVIQDNQELTFKDEGNAHFIYLKEPQKIGAVNSLDVYYEGNPKEAVRPPWDGGVTWDQDKDGNHFIATSCQGLGASVWWPCKDHMYDEVDSMLISVNVPKNLMDVSNGRLRSIEQYGDTKTYNWFVKNPINNYGVNINIANYVEFSEVYDGISGNLTMDYYVLPYNLEKAKEQFKDAPKMMKAFEYWFGPYPFYGDGFKLVEAPYLGMEHQSSVTYGNQYINGFKGRDLSGSGWGLKFDYIIIHESGHEWFANNITYKDIADMWIHESFTTYSESLFVEYYYGKKAASEYVIGMRNSIKNDKPIIGNYDVNNEGSGDMYYKGSNMLHTLRQVINDDENWRDILRGLNREFYHQTVTTKQIENYISEQAGMDLKPFFDQYLRDTRIPILLYITMDNTLKFRWSNVVDGFKMPIKVSVNGKWVWLDPEITWKSIELDTPNPSIKVDQNFYVSSERL